VDGKSDCCISVNQVRYLHAAYVRCRTRGCVWDAVEVYVSIHNHVVQGVISMMMMVLRAARLLALPACGAPIASSVIAHFMSCGAQ
jgi:hypothetical protein